MAKTLSAEVPKQSSTDPGKFVIKFTLRHMKHIDPSGHGGIGGHYFHAWSVRPSEKQKTLTLVSKNKIFSTTDTMHANNDHLLVVAWWVILNSLELLYSFN